MQLLLTKIHTKAPSHLGNGSLVAQWLGVLFFSNYENRLQRLAPIYMKIETRLFNKKSRASPLPANCEVTLLENI